MTAHYDKDADDWPGVTGPRRPAGQVIQLHTVHPSLLPHHRRQRPGRFRRLLAATHRRPRLSWFEVCDTCGSCRPERGYCPGCSTR